MGGLLKSVQTISQSADCRNISSSSSPNLNQEHHITVGQVSRDFSSVGTEEHDRGNTVAFVVGKTFCNMINHHVFTFIVFAEKVRKGSY